MDALRGMRGMFGGGTFAGGGPSLLHGASPAGACRSCTSSFPAGAYSPASNMMVQQNMLMELMVMMLMSLMLGQVSGPGRGAARGGFGGGGLSGGGVGAGGGSSPSGHVQAGGSAAPALTSSGPTNAKTQKFIDKAKSHQGAPYVFGAAGSSKFDCSGLVYYSLREAGVNVPRLTARGYQARYANSKVSRDQLKPGDLVFFHSPNDRGIPEGKATHIEIYLGNGMTMGTDNPGEGARIEPINWNTFIGGARVPELNN